MPDISTTLESMLLCVDVYNDTSVFNNEYTIVDEQDAGSFFARAYESEVDNTIVISFRGTDDLQDLLTDYASAIGNAETQQIFQAIEFYHSIETKAALSGREVVFAGHSLGGGLAGFMAKVYAKKGYIFDTMTFDDAADCPKDWANRLAANEFDSDPEYKEEIEEYLATVYRANNPAISPSTSGIKSYSINVEFLELNRIGSPTQPTQYSLNADLGIFGRHSMSLLALKQYAENMRYSDLMSKVEPFFIHALF